MHDGTRPAGRRDDTKLHGLGTLGLLHAAAFSVGTVVNGFADEYEMLILLSCFGLVQLAWGAPLAVYFHWRGRPNARRGAVLGMAITLLLNAGCWGVALATL